MKIREYRIDDHEAVAEIWWRETLRMHPLHSERADPGHWRRGLERWLVPRCEVLVAVETGAALAGAVAGFLALREDEDYLDQLYVRRESWSRGVGSALLAEARRRRPEGLELHVLAHNHRALGFYRRHGFHVAGWGFAVEERLPDLLLRWRPEDGVSVAECTSVSTAGNPPPPWTTNRSSKRSPKR